jgi:two-component system, chemotaxis family, CheB/CheR fusion protein
VAPARSRPSSTGRASCPLSPLDLKRRLFRKLTAAPVGLGHFSAQSFVHERTGEIRSLDQLRDYAFSASPVAQVLVTGEDIVALVNQQA